MEPISSLEIKLLFLLIKQDNDYGLYYIFLKYKIEGYCSSKDSAYLATVSLRHRLIYWV